MQLAIAPDSGSPEQVPQDPWETIVSGLEALGGPLDQDDSRTLSVEEVPLIQADLTYGDILREGTLSHLARPSLLAITLLPSGPKKASTAFPPTPPIPPPPACGSASHGAFDIGHVDTRSDASLARSTRASTPSSQRDSKYPEGAREGRTASSTASRPATP